MAKQNNAITNSCNAILDVILSSYGYEHMRIAENNILREYYVDWNGGIFNNLT